METQSKTEGVEQIRSRVQGMVWQVVRGDPAPLHPLGRALGAHFHLSLNNRLLVAAQAPQALRVKNLRQWGWLGYRPGPGAPGVLIVGSRAHNFEPTRLYSEAEVGAPAAELALNPATLGAALGLEQGDQETFLWEGLRWMQNYLGHARNPRLWEELKLAELWLALRALEGLLCVVREPDLDRVMVERAYGARPALLMKSLERVGAGVDALSRRLGLAWK
ncbi:MAG: hypothetical protein KatS3mg071_1574 [Meiothermus sp.]|nr:MAG: hypothetical protein KatS3mg071_1574 [Meiothermus sp.]